MKYSILYRGPLSSCNYTCWYCPFAKNAPSAKEETADRQALERFVGWVAGRAVDRLSVFFTPWGEGLIHRRYQQALVELSHMPHVEKVTIQTNLSCGLDWAAEADRRRLALWTTYHPPEIPRARFVEKCRALVHMSLRFSVGVVGLREHVEAIEALRRELPPHVYLWINAYKHADNDYTKELVRRFEAVDPLFPYNNKRHPSLGRPCRCGHTVFSIYGDGTIQRCHFVKEPIGNLYALGFESALRRAPCPNATCGCHIGYAHMDDLDLYAIFGAGVLERIPYGLPGYSPAHVSTSGR